MAERLLALENWAFDNFVDEGAQSPALLLHFRGDGFDRWAVAICNTRPRGVNDELARERFEHEIGLFEQQLLESLNAGEGAPVRQLAAGIHRQAEFHILPSIPRILHGDL